MCDFIISGPKTEAEIAIYYDALTVAQGTAGWEWYKNPTPEIEAAVAAVETKYEQVCCDGPEEVLRGDLFYCREHARDIPWTTGRVEGEQRCTQCGYWRSTKENECGLPCNP